MRYLLLIVLTLLTLLLSDVHADWEKTQILPEGEFSSIYFIDDSTGWMTCADGKILKTTDGGNNWDYYQYGSTDDILLLTGLDFTDEQNGWCVGYRGLVLHTTDAGETWNKQEINSNGYFGSCKFTDSLTGWIGNVKGEVFKTIDGGKNWTLHKTFKWIDDIYFINKNIGLISDEEGNIHRTSDAGETWSTNNIFDSDLFTFDFIDEKVGYIGGLGGVLFKTTDSGETWTEIETDISYSFMDIQFLDENVAWAVFYQDCIAKTEDGGKTWAIQYKGPTDNEAIIGIHMFNETKGITTGNLGYIFKTNDGGVSVIEELISGNIELKVFPNPCSDKIKFSFTNDCHSIDIQITDLNGKIVLKKNTLLNGETVDINMLPIGTYLISTTSGSKHDTWKIIKK